MRDMFARQGLTPYQVIESDEVSLPQSLVRAGVGLSLLREDVALPGTSRPGETQRVTAGLQALLADLVGDDR